MRRRVFAADLVYLVIAGGGGLFFTVAFTLSAIYRVREAGLSPFQLVLLGTALEGAVLLCEVPTGVVADLYSRRLSVIIGYALIGVGITLEGAIPRFETILLAQILWGVGLTFTSGAETAWLADEVGEERAGRLYLRAAQLGQVGAVVGILGSVALASVRLNLPLLVGGMLFIALAGFLVLAMPERGFAPTPRGERTTWRTGLHTARDGVRVVRGHRVLGTIFLIIAISGAASEAFDRLWEIHFLENFAFPAVGDLSDLVWFGIIDGGALLIGIGAAEVVRRRLDTTDVRAVARLLLVFNAGLAGAVLLFGLAWGFVGAAGAYWAVLLFRRLNEPLQAIWINRGLDSGTRATVLSLGSQSDAVGQVAGGPVLGAVASGISIRAALVTAGLVLSPVLVLYARTLRHGGAAESSPAATGPPGA